jgi:hypothetical protein
VGISARGRGLALPSLLRRPVGVRLRAEADEVDLSYVDEAGFSPTPALWIHLGAPRNPRGDLPGRHLRPAGQRRGALRCDGDRPHLLFRTTTGKPLRTAAGLHMDAGRGPHGCSGHLGCPALRPSRDSRLFIATSTYSGRVRLAGVLRSLSAVHPLPWRGHGGGLKLASGATQENQRSPAP